MHPVLRRLDELRAARMVELDAAEERRPWTDRIALMRETDRAVDALLGQHCWWRLYDPQTGLTGLLNVTVNWNLPRRVRRLRMKRQFERDQIRNCPRRHPLSKRSRAHVARTLANWDRAEDLEKDMQDRIFATLTNGALMPYTDVGIEVIANAFRVAARAQVDAQGAPMFIPDSVFVTTQAGEDATLEISYSATLVAPITSVSITSSIV